ncbi:MAG: hypothetical protein DCC49_07300 [Acidobacteria bacterium]|nr:MAG: hypothetical protein DCC49_07300 [Acidobacteriota bacterium]
MVVAGVVIVVLTGALFFLLGKSTSEKVVPATQTSATPSESPTKSPSASPTRAKASPSQTVSVEQIADSLADKAVDRLNASDKSGFAALWLEPNKGKERYDLMTGYLGVGPKWSTERCKAYKDFYLCQLYRNGEMAGALTVAGPSGQYGVTDWVLSLD